jgi:hypothetical protein
VRIGYGSSFFWHPYWGYWGWGHAWGPGYGYYPPVNYSRTREYRMGALDLRVDPKRAEIYVDGQYVGLAKQYDGFPGHLWLESGVYEIAFYKPGYETQTRTVKVLTDLVLEMDIELLEGHAELPERRFGARVQATPPTKVCPPPFRKFLSFPPNLYLQPCVLLHPHLEFHQIKQPHYCRFPVQLVLYSGCVWILSCCRQRLR